MGKKRSLSVAFPKSEVLHNSETEYLTLNEARNMVIRNIKREFRTYTMLGFFVDGRGKDDGTEKRTKKMKPVAFCKNYVVFQTEKGYRMCFGYVDVIQMMRKGKMKCF